MTQPSRLLAGLALGTLLLSPPLFAQGSAADWTTQEPESAPQRSAEDEKELARSLRRILILQNRQVLRGVARLKDGAWQLKSKGKWTSIDARGVESYALEKKVLAELRRRERALRKQKHSSVEQRVELARWMADSGLLSESLQQIDKVLADEPHDRAARELLLERRFVRVPSLHAAPEEAQAALSQLITFGAKAPRSVRELAIEELRNAPDEEAVRTALMAELGHNSLRRRSFASHAMGRLHPGEELQKLLLHSVLDASAEVRRESSYALGANEEAGVIVPLVKALNSRNPRVRAQAAEALGNAGFVAAVEPLVTRLAFASAQGSSARRVPHANIFIGKQTAYVQDFDVEVAQFQAVADPQINVLIEGSVLDAGIQSVTAYGFAYETKVLRGALGQLTHESPGYSSRAWLRWWEENQDKWGSARLSRPTAPAVAIEDEEN